MSEEKILKSMYERLESEGGKGKIVSINHVEDLKKELEKAYQSDLFDDEFYQKELTGFNFRTPEHNPDAKSLIVVAVPQPLIRVIFNLDGKPFPCLIPPNYNHKTDGRAKKILESRLKQGGYHLKRARLPLKPLAVHSGLAQYGRNNISYVQGMGSFHRLVAFYSDFPCLEDNWGDLRIMERCDACRACQKICPTDAIPSDRFLLRAERCISFFSETQGEFPLWLEPSWHNCLVGCFLCQKVCPADKDFLEIIEEGPIFSPLETKFILQAKAKDEMSELTIEKLESLDIVEYIDVLGRNLRALLDHSKKL
ncbi:MAG: FeS-binding protein [Candidatus Aminicenantes bacterium]|nr:FeS-binding protein [Candidatus Aminicenantes bacterium]